MIQIVFYIGFIILADILAARWIIPLPFGLFVPAGVFAIAPIFTLRDSLHRKYGIKIVTGLVFIASAISYLVSIILGNELLGKVTIASLIAFLISENADTLIYHLIKKESWMKRVMTSNAVSAFLDSVIFIGLAFGIVWPLILGQYIVKMIVAWVTGLVLSRRSK